MIYVLYVKKIVKNCHKDIRCKTCKGFVHKKCTNLKPKYLKSEEAKDWVCQTCNIQMDSECDIENDTNNLNESPEFNITNVDFQKYDNMIFNPLPLGVGLQCHRPFTFLAVH